MSKAASLKACCPALWPGCRSWSAADHAFTAGLMLQADSWAECTCRPQTLLFVPLQVS